MSTKINSQAIIPKNYQPKEHLPFKTPSGHSLDLNMCKLIIAKLARSLSTDIFKLIIPTNLSSKEVRVVAKDVARLSKVNRFFCSITQPYLSQLKDISKERVDAEKDASVRAQILNSFSIGDPSRHMQRKAALDDIIKALGGIDKFHTYQVLNENPKYINNNSIGISRSEFFEKKALILIGYDKGDVPFISLLLKDKKPIPLEDNDNTDDKQMIEKQNQFGFPVTFFLPADKSEWFLGFAMCFCDQDSLKPAAKAIGEILSGNHPEYTLGKLVDAKEFRKFQKKQTNALLHPGMVKGNKR